MAFASVLKEPACFATDRMSLLPELAVPAAMATVETTRKVLARVALMALKDVNFINKDSKFDLSKAFPCPSSPTCLHKTKRDSPQ